MRFRCFFVLPKLQRNLYYYEHLIFLYKDEKGTSTDDCNGSERMDSIVDNEQYRLEIVSFYIWYLSILSKEREYETEAMQIKVCTNAELTLQRAKY
jgi:hypothetical protein